MSTIQYNYILLNHVKTYFSVKEEYTFSTGSELTFFKVTKILTNLSDWSQAEKGKNLLSKRTS